MELREATKQILRERNKTQQWLSEQTGYCSRSALQNVLARGNVEMNTLFRICDAIGARIFLKYDGKEVELTRREKK